MEIDSGIYGLPQQLELHGETETIFPVAVEKESGLLLVDAGLPGKLEKIEEGLESHGFSLSDVEEVVLTHQDFDHCGGLKELVERTGATVYAHEADAPAIDGRENPIKGDDRYPAADVDVELCGGEKFNVKAGTLRVVNTPGHTPGHVSLLIDDLLIAGDLLFNEETGLEGPRKALTPEMEEAANSIHRVSFRDFSEVHCYHGGKVDAGPEKVRGVAEQILEDFPGYRKASFEGPVNFTRKKLENSDVGLSVFEIEAGESHGAQGSGEMYRHSRQTETYFVRKGSGSFQFNGETESFEAGDAFLVRPYRFRKVEADTDTELVVAGAPVGDETEVR